MKKVTLCYSTVIHFLVDLSCIYFLSGVLIPMAMNHDEWLRWAVFYNFMAFAMAAPIGFLADRLIRRHRLLLSGAGCLLISGGYFLFRTPYAALVFVGLGNAMFHVGAGMEVLRDARKSYAPPGIFIASGALGVFLGSSWGTAYIPLWDLFQIIMAVCGLVLSVWDLVLLKAADGQASMSSFSEPDISMSAAPQDNLPRDIKKVRLAVLCISSLFLVVVIRSYYGSILSYDWKTGFRMGLIFTLCIAAGKALGGVAADHLGIHSAIWISLGLGAASALFSFQNAVIGCISILLFNMTMPLTLSLLVKEMPRYPGFAFGFLMLALFLGTLPVTPGGFHAFKSPAGLSILCLVSLVLLLAVLRVRKAGDAS